MTSTTLVVLVVVPHEGRYLIVEECDGTFYLPAGRVEPFEDLVTAAIRETREEAGVVVRLRGILGIEHRGYRGPDRMRFRFAFVGCPDGPATPKSHADEHSRGAAWLTKEEIASRPLRDPEVLAWIERYERAEALLPCAAYEPSGMAPRSEEP